MPFNSIFSWFIKKRITQIELFKAHPDEVQRELFQELIHKAKNTEFGLKYGFGDIRSFQDFQNNVPLQDYDDLKPYVDRMMKNEQNLLWPSEIKWFAKSSGTTSEKSKFIPVSAESIEDCHFKGGKDLLSIYYNQFPNTKLYKGKNLTVGGSAEIIDLGNDSYYGDLSAIILKNLPWWAEFRRTPSKKIALMSEWEEKIEKMALNTKNEDVSSLTGVPSWTLVLLNKILSITGASDIKELWPNLEMFMHGGVSFKPYRSQFEQIISGDMNYIETYNASEGFFGIQDQYTSDALLLMLDYGIFYEFIPMSEYDGVNSKKVLTLEEVEPNVNYAVVISTNGGLWRYIIGDTIQFTEILPFRFEISGRTKHYINTFGEELIVDNAEKAIAEACKKTNAKVKDFTAAPIYMENKGNGGHEWLIEFRTLPSSESEFVKILDAELQNVNTDYAAKRVGDLTLAPPLVHFIEIGVFEKWLKEQKKLGGQHKVPRLMNNRSVIESIKECISASKLV